MAWHGMAAAVLWLRLPVAGLAQAASPGQPSLNRSAGGVAGRRWPASGHLGWSCFMPSISHQARTKPLGWAKVPN